MSSLHQTHKRMLRFICEYILCAGLRGSSAGAKELGKAYPELGDEFGLTAIELGFLNERR